MTSLESCFLNFGPFQLSDQKPLREIFPQLFSEEPDDKRNYLVSKNSFDDVNAVPITYHELESAMGMELLQTINPDVKIVLIIAPGQNLAWWELNTVKLLKREMFQRKGIDLY